MYLARVTGSCTATIKTDGLHGHRLLVLQPLTFAREENGEPFIAVDTVRAGPDDIVFYVTSREAAKALADEFNPVDVAILGIVDEVRYQPWHGGTT
ncbi:MAG: EutN/CcmL family microcompartment protein [bacterium]